MRLVVTARAFVLVALALSSTPLVAQPHTPPSGHWKGEIQIPGQPLGVEIDLLKTGERWDGTITVPAQQLKAFPLSLVSVTGDAVTLEMKVPGAPQFKGTVSKDGQTLSGDFSQGGGTVPFTLTRTGDAVIAPQPKSTAIAKELEGSWEGALDVGGKALRLALTLSSRPDGTGTGTLVSIDQGSAEIPIAAVVQTGSRVMLLIPSIAGRFEGELAEGVLSGTWTQGPGSLPLTFKRTK